MIGREHKGDRDCLRMTVTGLLGRRKGLDAPRIVTLDIWWGFRAVLLMLVVVDDPIANVGTLISVPIDSFEVEVVVVLVELQDVPIGFKTMRSTILLKEGMEHQFHSRDIENVEGLPSPVLDFGEDGLDLLVTSFRAPGIRR